MKRIVISLALVALAGVGCGDDSVRSDPMNALHGLSASQQLLIDGTYESDCSLVQSAGSRSYLKISIRFLNPASRGVGRYQQSADGTWIDTAPYGVYTESITYRDSSCTEELIRTENKGEFEFLSQARILKVASKATGITPMLPVVAQEMSRQELCGIKDWKAGTEEDILGTDCMTAATSEVLFLDQNSGNDLTAFDGFICDGNAYGPTCSKLKFQKK